MSVISYASFLISQVLSVLNSQPQCLLFGCVAGTRCMSLLSSSPSLRPAGLKERLGKRGLMKVRALPRSGLYYLRFTVAMIPKYEMAYDIPDIILRHAQPQLPNERERAAVVSVSRPTEKKGP